jgi:EAL domain-containing protein (putative c-di-GMP-specific phosphodiesterase class I)
VETADQLKFLRSERCHTVQGYYLHRPLPERELAAALKLNRVRRDGLVPVYA